MVCRVIAAGLGVMAIACGPRARVQKCGVPGCGRDATVECDFPIPVKAKTCSAKLCAQHATKTGEGQDHCPPHAKMEIQRASG